MENCAGAWAIALGLWLGLGFSVGWYYTVTYYGRTGLPIPTPEVCASLILYYFSVLNVDTEIQAIHWMIVFPATGALWACLLAWLAPRSGAPRPNVAHLALRLSVASLPLILPGPWMAWIAGTTEAGFDWSRMLEVALRRGWVTPWSGLNTLYVICGLAVLALQVTVYRTVFATKGRLAVLHVTTAGIALILAAAVLGSIIAWPLRWALE